MERFEWLNGRQKASPKRYREESVAQLAADIDNGLHNLFTANMIVIQHR